MNATPPRPSVGRRFEADDGTALAYSHWPAACGAPRGAVLLFHRGHEHAGRMAHLVDELALPDFDFYAWDARGHGRSPGARGHAPSFAALVRDVQAFAGHIAAVHGIPVDRMAIVAQSVGAVVTAAWVHDYAPPLRALVLAAPAFRVRLYVPFARPGLALAQRLSRKPLFVQSYVKARLLTHDAARIASYERDPLVSRAIAVNVLLGLAQAGARLVDDAQAIVVPVQLLVSGADWVVDRGPQHAFFDRLGSAVKERHELQGFYHDTLGEAGRAAVVAKVRDFVVGQFDAPAAAVDLAHADARGATKDEADALARPLPAWSPRGLWWAATRASLRFGATLSSGLALGRDAGFDSGSTLDYVYRNVAAGRGPLGRAIDRHYLDAIGWRGIRVRKTHVEALVREAMARLRARGLPVRIVDVAAGHGRYVLDALDGAPCPDDVLLRDAVEANVAQGRALIAARGLGGVARFAPGDAFDRAALAALDPRPTLGVVSGLYELYGDNALVGRSLAGLADALGAGGFLVYTNQPWHPQLALIARALTSHRGGRAWVMRRRTQAEIDQLVAAAGFRKVAQRIDDWGIFTVSLAERA